VSAPVGASGIFASTKATNSAVVPVIAEDVGPEGSVGPQKVVDLGECAKSVALRFVTRRASNAGGIIRASDRHRFQHLGGLVALRKQNLQLSRDLTFHLADKIDEMNRQRHSFMFHGSLH